MAEFLDGLNDIILDLDDLVATSSSSSIDAGSANTSTSSTNVEELSSSTSSSAPLLLTFSHFLPRIELLPEKRYLSLPTLHSCVGSTYLETRLRQLRRRSCIHDDDDTDDTNTANNMGDSDHLHAFGHSHLAWDQCIEGIRYVHVPLAYPREWEQRRRSLEIGSMSGEDSEMRLPVCIWDSSSSSSSTPSSSSSPNVGNDEGNESNTAATTTTSGFPTYWLGGWWSKYYAVMERQPHRNTELAPWAARRFR